MIKCFLSNLEKQIGYGIKHSNAYYQSNLTISDDTIFSLCIYPSRSIDEQCLNKLLKKQLGKQWLFFDDIDTEAMTFKYDEKTYNVYCKCNDQQGIEIKVVSWGIEEILSDLKTILKNQDAPCTN